MHDPQVAVIVQARLNSHRLPRKILADINGKPLLWHVLTRARKIYGQMWCLAIPATDQDELRLIADECQFELWPDRGDENDVLGRYYNAATFLRLAPIDHVVRITADCPLIDPDRCNRLIYTAVADRAFYRSNVWPERTVPSGYDCEVFTMHALSVANRFARESEQREHVTPFMRECLRELAASPQEAGISFETKALLGEKCSVDTEDELNCVRRIIEAQPAA